MHKSNGASQTEDIKKRIYAGVLEKIMSRAFAPGHHLVEEELARAYQTSRTPVREVLFALEKDGLIERVRGRGARVASFSPDDVEDIYEIRKALETVGLSRAVRNLSLSDLLELKQQLERANRQSGPACHRLQMELDLKLHHMIVTASGNRRIIAYMESLGLLVNSLKLVSYRDDEHARQVGEQHLGIVEALLRRDAAEAERRLRSHIEDGCRNAIELFFRRSQGVAAAQDGDRGGRA